jgi:hypothetical protein
LDTLVELANALGNDANLSVTITSQIANVNANITTANIGMKGYVDSVASQSIYGNGNVTAYTVSMGFTNFSNVNVSALITTNGLTNYSNVNLIAYLAGGVTSTGFINTSGNVSAAQINSATAVVTGSAFFGELFVKSPGGDEGGQLNLAPAVTNTTLAGNVVIDVFQNKLRIFEGGGTARGGYFDISGLAAGVATNLAAGGGGGTPGGGQGQIQFNSSSTFAGAASLYYFGANGAIVANAGIASTSTTTGTMQITGGVGISGNVWADRIHAVNNGNGTNFRVGDDAWLGDINVANTVRLMGAQDNTQAFLRFGNVNTNALGVNGSGPLSWGGVLNVTGNILGATASFGAINSTGLINTTGNIICASISAGTYVGLSSNKINTNASNVTVTASFVNVAVNGSNVAAFSATGFIVGIDSGATSIRNAGTNGIGNIGATGATFNTVFAKATTAQYADLAEIYTSDQQYPGGTVVVFGGEAEVTQSHSPHDTRIAGVVSTNPAYLMNHDAIGVPVALQGRVPCQVLGPVAKGDRLVASQHPGIAQRLNKELYEPGCIIGKALQAIDSTDISTIEVVVGRL